MRHSLIVLGGGILLGPAAGLGGYYLLADFPAALGAIMLFASGGLLYLISQDIAPQSCLNRHWAPGRLQRCVVRDHGGAGRLRPAYAISG